MLILDKTRINILVHVPIPDFQTLLIHIMNASDQTSILDMRIHQVPPKIYHTYQKKKTKSRLSDPFFGIFLVISEVGAQIV